MQFSKTASAHLCFKHVYSRLKLFYKLCLFTTLIFKLQKDYRGNNHNTDNSNRCHPKKHGASKIYINYITLRQLTWATSVSKRVFPFPSTLYKSP